MKKIFLFFVVGFLLLASSSQADIVVTVYGAGGIIAHPDGTNEICPDESTDKCATITLPDDDPKGVNFSNGHGVGVLEHEGNTYEVNVIYLSKGKCIVEFL